MPSYQIGEGVRAAMTGNQDEPRGDEEYRVDADGSVLYSITQGRDFVYRWTPQDAVKVVSAVSTGNTDVYAPSVFWMPAQHPAGRFAGPPRGWALHGTRSGRDFTTAREFDANRHYGVTTQLAFNNCIGDDAVSIHLDAFTWGWHAFSASSKYLALEFAQPGFSGYEPISDRQVNAAAWIIKQHRAAWRGRGVVLPLRLRTHAELEHDGETVQTSGKTDTFPVNDGRADDLRNRLLLRLALLGER